MRLTWWPAGHPADWCRPGEYCCPEVAAVHSLWVRLFSSHEDAVQYAAQHSSAQLADAFAAGAVLFEMVTGRKPGWDASTVRAVACLPAAPIQKLSAHEHRKQFRQAEEGIEPGSALCILQFCRKSTTQGFDQKHTNSCALA